MTDRWEPAFAAVSALLGEPLPAIEATLGEGAVHAAEVMRSLASSSRTVRAEAIAAGVARVATGVDAMRMT